MQTVASTRTLRPNYQYIRAGGLEFVFDFFVELVGPRSSSHLSLWAPRILECQLSSLILCCVSNLPSCKLQPDLKGLLGQLGFRSYGSLLRPAAKFQQAAEVGSGSNRQSQLFWRSIPEKTRDVQHCCKHCTYVLAQTRTTLYPTLGTRYPHLPA